jgi:hypothetical protein
MKKILVAASAAVISLGFAASMSAANAANDDGLSDAIKGVNLDETFTQGGGSATPLELLLRDRNGRSIDGGPTGSVGAGSGAVDGVEQPLPNVIDGTVR